LVGARLRRTENFRQLPLACTFHPPECPLICLYLRARDAGFLSSSISNSRRNLCTKDTPASPSPAPPPSCSLYPFSKSHPFLFLLPFSFFLFLRSEAHQNSGGASPDTRHVRDYARRARRTCNMFITTVHARVLRVYVQIHTQRTETKRERDTHARARARTHTHMYTDTCTRLRTNGTSQ